ncbi:MAG: hypothetical protein HFI49_00145 [Bacilli bacterium]|jgi:putative Mn2+ efflux pump MntP|nr:hypothetical protein [Bacilli bacterium]
MQILSILLIGIALSMDTFSLSLSLGTFNITNKQALKLSIIVGIMHFFMPIIGMLLGEKLINLFELQCDFLLGVILLFIAIQMIIDLIKHEENSFNLNILGMFLFALGVSLDSFSVGLGIKAITDNINLATSIFAICSFIFTFTGIMIGKFANKFIGTYASIFGVVILLILGIVHIV